MLVVSEVCAQGLGLIGIRTVCTRRTVRALGGSATHTIMGGSKAAQEKKPAGRLLRWRQEERLGGNALALRIARSIGAKPKSFRF